MARQEKGKKEVCGPLHGEEWAVLSINSSLPNGWLGVRPPVTGDRQRLCLFKVTGAFSGGNKCKAARQSREPTGCYRLFGGVGCRFRDLCPRGGQERLHRGWWCVGRALSYRFEPRLLRACTARLVVTDVANSSPVATLGKLCSDGTGQPRIEQRSTPARRIFIKLGAATSLALRPTLSEESSKIPTDCAAPGGPSANRMRGTDSMPGIRYDSIIVEKTPEPPSPTASHRLLQEVRTRASIMQGLHHATRELYHPPTSGSLRRGMRGNASSWWGASAIRRETSVIGSAPKGGSAAPAYGST